MGVQPIHSDDVFGTTMIKLEPGTTKFSRIPNSWSDAWLDRRMNDAAMKVIHFFCRKPQGFRVTHRTLAKRLGMGLTTITSAISNLHELGVALRHSDDGRTTGYELNMNIEIPEKPAFRKVKEDNSVPETVTMRSQNGNASVPETGTLYKRDSEDTSLRSEERAGPSILSGPASARPTATISADKAGQVGFGFSDDQGVIPESDIQRIMDELRKLDIKGNPEDYELRDFITSRIAFMTAPEFRGQKMQRGGKETMQANRNKVIGFCMRIISKPDYRWSSKRVNPEVRGRAESIRQQIAKLERQSQTYRMKDGRELNVSDFDALMLKLRTHQEEMITARMARRPKGLDYREWRDKVRSVITIEAAAYHLYGKDAADSYIPAEDDRLQYRRQANDLREELARMS